ncbi:MAG: molecular chaperone TorD family protein [Planctomycetes bacterium]|nr:molecular chaperone TorD family protein [Planctomycetota bacterium]
MSAIPGIPTAFERARRYQELSQRLLQATADDPTLSPENPPYETQYGAAHVFAQSNELADIAGFYRAFGLAAPATERIDHIAVEFEFMSFLAFKEAYALYCEEADRAAQVRGIQVKFMTDHVGRWVPAFAAKFEGRDASLAREVREWVASDAAALGAKPVALRDIDLHPAGEADEPFECGGGTCEMV